MAIRFYCFLLVILALLAAGCGPKVNMNSNEFDEDLRPLTKRELSSISDSADVQSLSAVVLPKLREGNLARADVVAVLDAGPAAFLRDIDLEAITEGNKFNGWQIVGIVSRDSPVAQSDLQNNDVIRTVNGQMIATPDQLMSVWDSLRTANKIEVEVIRNQVAYLLAFRIVDDPPPPAATPAK